MLARWTIKPRLIGALGATAGRSLFGRPVTIGKMRGHVHRLDDGTAAILTTHPSALLRMPDAAERAAAFKLLVRDLQQARDFLAT